MVSDWEIRHFNGILEAFGFKMKISNKSFLHLLIKTDT